MAKNGELMGKISSLEGSIQTREDQIANLRAELEALKQAFNKGLDKQEKLEEEFATVQQHIDELTHQNDELVRELQECAR